MTTPTRERAAQTAREARGAAMLDAKRLGQIAEWLAERPQAKLCLFDNAAAEKAFVRAALARGVMREHVCAVADDRAIEELTAIEHANPALLRRRRVMLCISNAELCRALVEAHRSLGCNVEVVEPTARAEEILGRVPKRPNGQGHAPPKNERAVVEAEASVRDEHPSATTSERADSTPGAWPSPSSLIAESRSAPYPLEALPGGIGDAVREVVQFVQCPPAIAACSGLAAISTAGQALVDVRRAENLVGPSSLYLLAVAESGERKTTCDAYFSAPLREWERDRARAAQPALVEHEAALCAWEAKRDGILARIKQATSKGEETAADETRLQALERQKPAPPVVPTLVHMDSTPEALAHAMAHGWPSGGVLSSEAGIVFGGHAMGRDSIMRNLALLNQLWEGGTVKVSRRTSESFTLSGARFTAGLAAQPETVRQFFEQSKGLARGTGFAARFLIAWPASTQGTRPFAEAPSSWPSLVRHNQRVLELLDTPLPRGGDGRLAPTLLDLTPKAKAAWVAFHDEVERELAPGGELTEARDVASKAADNVARMAALFHLYEYGPQGAIGEPLILAAARIVTWHLFEARRLLGELMLPKVLSDAAKLDRWLIDYCRRHETASVPHQRVRQYGPNTIRDRGALQAAIEELAEAGRARLQKEGRQKWIHVNPALLGASYGAP